MERYYLRDLLQDPSALTPEQGEKMYHFLRNKIEQTRSIEISFEGMEDFTTAFCNNSFGRLYTEKTAEVVDSYLSVSGLESNPIWVYKLTQAQNWGKHPGAYEAHYAAVEKVLNS